MTDVDEPDRDHNPGPASSASPAPILVDARGLLCPLPLVKAARAFHAAPPGFLIELLSDDPSARVDVPEWCAERGHTLVTSTGDGTTLRFLLRRGGE